MPAIVDKLDNRVNRAYGAQPDRLYLVGKDGKIAYAGDKGPRGFAPGELEDAIVAELAKIGDAPRPPGAPGVLLAALDRDGDGTLSDAELAGATGSLRRLDRNEDGKVTPDELGGRKAKTDTDGPAERRDPRARDRDGGRESRRGGSGRPSAKGLREMDANGDGKLARDEVPGFMKERWDFMDTDGDGFLDKQEQEALIDRIRRRSGRQDGGRTGRGQRPEPDREPRPGRDTR